MQMLKRVMSILAVVALASGFTSGFSSSRPEVWDIWEQNNPENTQTVDHSVWDKLLKTYIKTDTSGLNRFAYSKVTPEDQKKLETYLKQLSGIEISDRARPIQLAYWINLYNALTVKVILDNYPVKSIRDIDTSGIFSNGPWGAELIEVEEEILTLDDIEHAILRPIWKDPRIHYAVNCASVGCPNLHAAAFTANNTESLLEKGAKDYINSPRGLVIENGKVNVSKIYKWFAHDFGNSEKGIIKHLVKYATPERAAALKEIGTISGTTYDWQLNE